MTIFVKWKVKVKVTQSFDSLLPHGIVHGIFQARILEWVATPFSSGSSQPRSPPIQNKKLKEEYTFIAHVEADFLIIELITMFQ